jgi:hypothetical protein
VPSTGVSDVADEIDALNNTATGWLTVSPAGSSSSIAAVNFETGTGGQGATNFDNAVVVPASPSGAVTITNVSSGTVDVIVSARGYWLTATTPTYPTAVMNEYNYSTGQVTVAWANPDSDGGSAVTSYKVLDNGSTAATVVEDVNEDINSYTFTANPTDDISIYATNAAGSGQTTDAGTADSALNPDNTTISVIPSATYPSSTLPTLWSGTLVDGADGLPASANIEAYAVGPATTPGSEVGSEIPLAEGTTSATGSFSLAALPTADLSSAMYPDGTIDVMLDISSGDDTTVVEEPMQILSQSADLGGGITPPTQPTFNEGSSPVAQEILNEASGLEAQTPEEFLNTPTFDELPTDAQLATSGPSQLSLDSKWTLSTGFEETQQSANFQPNSFALSEDNSIVLNNSDVVDANSSDTQTAVPAIGMQSPNDLSSYEQDTQENGSGTSSKNEFCGQTRIVGIPHQEPVPVQTFITRPLNQAGSDGKGPRWGFGTNAGEESVSESSYDSEKTNGVSFFNDTVSKAQTTGTSTSAQSNLPEIDSWAISAANKSSWIDHNDQFGVEVQWTEWLVHHHAHCFSNAEVNTNSWSVTGGTAYKNWVFDAGSGSGGLLGCAQYIWGNAVDSNDPNIYLKWNIPDPSDFATFWNYKRFYGECLGQFQYHSAYHLNWEDNYGRSKGTDTGPDKWYIAVGANVTYAVNPTRFVNNPVPTALSHPNSCDGGIAEYGGGRFLDSNTQQSQVSLGATTSHNTNVPVSIGFSGISVQPGGLWDASSTNTNTNAQGAYYSNDYWWHDGWSNQDLVNEWLCPTAGNTNSSGNLAVDNSTLYTFSQITTDQPGDFIGSYAVPSTWQSLLSSNPGP